MTREEFGKIVAGMKAVYTDPKFLPDMHAIDIWYGFLRDLSNAQCQAAVSRYITTQKFPPTIAEIREMAVDNSNIGDDLRMVALEAWDKVRVAIHNGSYGADEEYEKLTPLTQKALGSPAALRAMAALNETEVETVAQAQFIKAYTAVAARGKEDAKIPASVCRLIDSVKQKGVEGRIPDTLPQKPQKIEAKPEIAEFKAETAGMPDDLSTKYEDLRTALGA